MFKLVLFCHVIKTVVGDYDFKCFKKVKTVVTNYDFKLKVNIIVDDYDFNYFQKYSH